MPIDFAALRRSITALEGIHPRDAGLDGSLQQVVDEADDLFDVDGAGLMLLDEDEVLRYVAASDEPGQALESIQEQVGEGPCVDAFERNNPTWTGDAPADNRWPAFGRLAGEHGIRAVLGVPVPLRGGALGTLNVYDTRPHEWDASEVEAITAYARISAALLRAAVEAEVKGATAEQLAFALEHRVLVEQAKGILMERERLDPRAAFERIRDHARSRRVKVIEVARQVVEGGRLPASTRR